MRHAIARTTLAITLSLGAAGLAEAQVAGLPVMNSGVASGIGFSLDAGFPNATAGGGWAGGATVKAGLGLIGVTASASRLDPKVGDPVWSGGATANLKVFGGPLVPIAVTLQGGAGYVAPEFRCLTPGACDIKEWHFPAGLGISLTVPNPALAIKPWIAPRADIVRTTQTGQPASTDVGFGISGGVELNFLNGMGLHAAYDWTNHDGAKPSVFSAGMHYTFRLPGL